MTIWIWLEFTIRLSSGVAREGIAEIFLFLGFYGGGIWSDLEHEIRPVRLSGARNLFKGYEILP